MSDEIGPIDFVLLEFPDQEPSGEAAAELMKLVDAGIIRIYDIVAVRKAADGAVEGIEIADLGDGNLSFSAFAGARSGLLGDDDVAEAAAALDPGTVAVLIVYENAWAGPFAAACLRHGGQMVASQRIPVTDVIALLDALDA
jgi:hypothetical protein